MIRLEHEIAPSSGALALLEPARRVAPLADIEVDRKIERTIAYMKEHLDQPMQAAVLASRANVSLSHYFALFKRQTGCTPIDFFIHLRMERAREMLETTGLTVKEVAAALGYDDPFYFSRVFKSINGLAPTDYRHAWREGALKLSNNTTASGAPELDAASAA
jgi:transcriptional regulator GlxA family with amidase domain